MLCKSCKLRTKFFIAVIRVSRNILSFATQQFIRLNLDKNKIFMQIDQLLLPFQRLSEIFAYHYDIKVLLWKVFMKFVSFG